MGVDGWVRPQVIITDKNPAYGEAMAELKKKKRLLPKDPLPAGEVPQQPAGGREGDHGS